MAFVQVAAGVFQMRASQVVALLVEEGAGRQKEDSQETNNRETAGDKGLGIIVSQNNLPVRSCSKKVRLLRLHAVCHIRVDSYES